MLVRFVWSRDESKKCPAVRPEIKNARPIRLQGRVGPVQDPIDAGARFRATRGWDVLVIIAYGADDCARPGELRCRDIPRTRGNQRGRIVGRISSAASARSSRTRASRSDRRNLKPSLDTAGGSNACEGSLQPETNRSLSGVPRFSQAVTIVRAAACATLFETTHSRLPSCEAIGTIVRTSRSL